MATVRGVVSAILGGGITAGACDFVFANVFYYLWKKIPPEWLWQSVASGWFGKAAFDGGWRMAEIGIGFHFFIATMMAAAYVLVSLRLKFLAAFPLVFGPLYGVFLYYAMNCVVLPLSNAAAPDISHLPMVGKSAFNFAAGLSIHVFGVGTPIALFARRRLKSG